MYKTRKFHILFKALLIYYPTIDTGSHQMNKVNHLGTNEDNMTTL